jgi:hypothetical protein
MFRIFWTGHLVDGKCCIAFSTSWDLFEAPEKHQSDFILSQYQRA